MANFIFCAVVVPSKMENLRGKVSVIRRNLNFIETKLFKKTSKRKKKKKKIQKKQTKVKQKTKKSLPMMRSRGL